MDKAQAFEKLRGAIPQLGKDLAADLEDVLDPTKLDAFYALVDEAADLKMKAVEAETPEKAKKWAKELEFVTRSIETRLLQERVVAEQALAATVSRALKGALVALGVVAKEAVALLVSGLIQGAKDSLA